MYVLVCMFTPGHTYTGTCVCDVMCMYVFVYVYTGSCVLRHVCVCVCVRPCDPLETKFTRSYHFLHRIAHTVPEARKPSPVPRGGGAEILHPHLDHTHGWRITEPRKRAVPFHRGEGKYIMISVYLYDLNHVGGVFWEGNMDAEEPQAQGRRRRKDVPFHGEGGGGGKGGKHVSLCL